MGVYLFFGTQSMFWSKNKKNSNTFVLQFFIFNLCIWHGQVFVMETISASQLDIIVKLNTTSLNIWSKRQPPFEHGRPSNKQEISDFHPLKCRMFLTFHFLCYKFYMQMYMLSQGVALFMIRNIAAFYLNLLNLKQ